MALLRELRSLNAVQRNTFAACFLGWTLDAFDYFLLTLCLTSIAADFHVGIKSVAEAIFWTLAMRPVGAFLFGLMAERFGRRPTLMLNIISFSALGLASAFAPTIGSFLICRALFGVAMVASGESARPSRSKPCPLKEEDSSPACCRKATLLGVCWRLRCTGCCSLICMGRGCLSGGE